MRTTAITAWALSTVLLALHNRGTAAAKPALRGLGAHAFPVSDVSCKESDRLTTPSPPPTRQIEWSYRAPRHDRQSEDPPPRPNPNQPQPTTG